MYVLGRASTADDVSMLSGMSRPSGRDTITTFYKKVVKGLYNGHVHLPEGGHLKEVRAKYRRKGFPRGFLALCGRLMLPVFLRTERWRVSTAISRGRKGSRSWLIRPSSISRGVS